METTNNKPSTLFWVIAIIAFLWNIMGILSFTYHTFMMTPEVVAQMPEAEQALFSQYPTWSYVVFGIATIAGLLGCIGLLMRKKWCKILFFISMVAVLIQMYQNIFMTDAIEVYGAFKAAMMPMLVSIIAIFLTFYSINLDKKGELS